MDRRNLKVLRAKYDLTQKEMAARIGCARSVYGEIENGTRNCSVAFLAKLQRAFNIPDVEIWEYSKIYDESEV